MAHTGLAIAEVMADLGAHVRIYDRKTPSELADEIKTARTFGAEPMAGVDAVDLSGVDLLIPSPGVPLTHPALQQASKRGIETISEIELAFRLSKAPIIAITGTNGKTTTTIITGRMLGAAGVDAYIAGNVAAGDIRMPLALAAHKAGEQSIIVAEISTFQLELIGQFRPRIAMLLNISSDHQDRHGTIEKYAALKARIFANQTADDHAIVNADSPLAAAIIPSLAANVLQFSIKSEPEQGGFVRDGQLILRFDGRDSVLCKNSDIPLMGSHSVENVLAAACAATLCGINADDLRRAVLDLTPIDDRLEPVTTINGVLYINNSMCTNVVAVVRSTEAIDRPQIIISGGKMKGAGDDYTAVGEVFSRKAKHLILIGADSGVLRAAAIKAGFGAITEAATMDEAVEIAHNLAQPGDAVVLTPGMASFDMFKSFEHRGMAFKQAVRRMEGGRR